MEDLIVKNVDVMGDFIVAAQDQKGNIWVGVRWICDALGMTEGQRKRQIKNIQKDMAFEGSGSNQILNRSSGEREVFCIKLDYVPLWLAKITITEKTREERPDFAEKLLNYQLKAKDILAAEFLPKQDTPPLTLKEQVQTIAASTVELYEKVENVEGRIKYLENTMNLDHGQQRKLEKAVNKTVLDVLGGKESNAYKQIGRKVFAECNGNLKDYFKVNARGDVPRKRYEEALQYAENWKPCTNTMMMIEQYNAQQSFDFGGGAGR